MTTIDVKDSSGRVIGEVRKVSVNRQWASETRYVAVPLSRVAHASSSGCPTFRLQREAVEALRSGTVVL